MREHPNGAELLAIAREVLRKELMPLLPKEKAYQALMIANAMSIAERQLQNGAKAEQEEHRHLEDLLGQSADLVTLNRLFATAIREGRFDGDASARRILLDATTQRVRESAPKALAGRG